MTSRSGTPVISVIIPVYNVEQYLRRCLDSVQAQTFDDFEAILVDDGSTDNSGAICDAYVRSDRRFTVIHQPNTGVSAARNAGLHAAQGKFITFVDADDEVVPKWLELLYAAFSEDVDLVSGSFIQYKNDVLVPDTKESKNRKLTRNQFVKKMSHYKERNTSRYMMTKLFDASIIRDNQLQFDTSITYREDSVFMYDYLFHCDKSVACISEPVYVYYRRSNGAAMTQLSRYTPQGKSYFWATEKILEMAEAHQQPYVTMMLLKNELAKSYWRLKRQMDKTGREELKAESQELHDHLVAHMSPLDLMLVNSMELYRTIRRKL